MHTVVRASATHVVAHGGGVVLRLLDGHGSRCADVDELSRLLALELERHAHVVYFQVIYPGTPPVEPEARRRGAALFESLHPRASAMFVLDGNDLWTTTLRLGMRAYTSLLRRSRATIESSLERGAFRISRELPDLDPEELLARCEELRAGMRMGAAS